MKFEVYVLTNSIQDYGLVSALMSCEIKPYADQIPRVKHKKVPFSRLLSQLEKPDQSVIDVYNLAHVLFDDYEDEFTHGLTKPLQKKFKDKIRKDRLTQFLVNHVSENINSDVKSLEQSDPLRAAVLRLVSKDIKGACQLLKDQRSVRLMLAVSQLDSADMTFMDAARDQIDAWRTQKSLSEFNLDIRALYEICAGNVTVCRGNEGKGVPVEDRAETFTISKRYNLNWLQCFALGLFYGRVEKASKTNMNTIEDAVLTFQRRCDRGEEPQKPAENDAMWALLQYYASQIVTDDNNQDLVPHPPFPECLGSLAKPWDHSDLFDFYQAMAANTTFVESFLKAEDVVKLDQLAELLSSELCAKGDVASATYALLHINDANTRKVLIQDLLDRFASDLPGPDTATSHAGIELWTRLTMDLKVPTSWLYMSKARYAASATNNGGDNIAELRFLVAAEAWELAHDCLLKRVAPSFTIDEDWAGLLEMCGLFGDDPVRKIPGWYDGGAVYQTFANLTTGQIAKNDTETISDLRKKLVTLGSRNAKTRVQLGRLGNHEREEHVAIREMANGLARLAMQGGSVGTVKEILELPVTQDVRADVAMCLGGEDFDSMMGSGAGRDTGKGRATRGRRGQGGPVQTSGDTEMADDGHGEESTA